MIRKFFLFGLASFLLQAGQAGVNQFAEEGAVVTLDCSGSLPPKPAKAVVTWTQVHGPDVTLTAPSKPVCRFTAPAIKTNQPELFSFDLKIERSTGPAVTDRIYVVVSHLNRAPVVEATPFVSTSVGDLVTLDGTKSIDPDGDALTFLWTQIQGEPVLVNSPRQAALDFIQPEAPTGTYPYRLTFQLVATDPYGATSKAVSQVMATDSQAVTAGYLDSAGAEKNEPSLVRKQMKDARQHANAARLNDRVAGELKQTRQKIAEGEWPEALRLAEHVLTIRPTSDEASELIKKAEGDRLKKFNDAWEAGRKYFQSGDYLGAIRAFQTARDILPARADVPALLRFSILALEDQATLDSSALAVQTAAAPTLDDNVIRRSRACYTLGLTYYSQGRLKEAAELWRKAADMNPANQLAVTAFRRVMVEVKN